MIGPLGGRGQSGDFLLHSMVAPVPKLARAPEGALSMGDRAKSEVVAFVQRGVARDPVLEIARIKIGKS